jgi:Ca2+-binding RTX toxin-like protein
VAVAFNEVIQASAPALANVSVRVNGAIRTVSSLSVDTATRRLLLNLSSLEAAPLYHETVRVEYSDPVGDQGGGVLQDSVGNDLASFGREADTLRSASSVPASPALATAYSTLVLTGSSGLSGVGNAGANLMVGNTAANSLDGGAGNDDLQGGAGNDTLVGGLGNDSLRGGAGLDRLSGGGGDDLFDFSGSGTGLIGGTSSNPQFERITDLQIAQAGGSDRIDTIASSSRAVRVLSGKPTTLSRSAITTFLNGSTGGVANFAAAGASVFTFGSGTGLRTFLAVNDAVAGYDSAVDQLLEITGASGTLANLSVF